MFSFQVFGVGLPNPYRLRPFLGARVPLNFSFSTILNMHNPYDSPLQVSSLTGLTAQECLHIIVVQLITNYLFQSKQQCAAITIITTASVYHINLEKSISISVFSSLSCVSSVLLDYCRNMGWMCFIVSMWFWNQRLLGIKSQWTNNAWIIPMFPMIVFLCYCFFMFSVMLSPYLCCCLGNRNVFKWRWFAFRTSFRLGGSTAKTLGRHKILHFLEQVANSPQFTVCNI